MSKKLLLITSVMLLGYIHSFCQTGFSYEAEWKVVDSLINKKSQPKSALVEVNKIYAAAKKDNNEGQWVKAIIYKNDLGEGGNQDINKEIQGLEREMGVAPSRVVAVFKSMEAEQLSQYLLGNIYRVRSRTEIIADTSSDISTWTIRRLNAKICSLYLASIDLPVQIKMTPLDVFDPILIKGNARELRPTLYDFLAWRALDYFREDRWAPDSEDDDSLWINPGLFSEALLFMHSHFSNSDTSSNAFYALSIYQSLLRFHAKDIHPDAWIDADMSRIQFVYQLAKMDDKDSLYLNALSRITNRYPTLSVVSQAYYLQARWWSNQAEKYEPLGDTTHRFDYLKSLEICRQAIRHPDSSEGKSNAEVLINDILRQSYDINIEQVNLPDVPFRALVTSKNTGGLYARIIRMDQRIRNLMDQNDNSPAFWSKFIHLPFEKSFTQPMPQTKDHQQHRVEIKIDALPVGQYALLTSSDSAFSDRAIIGLATFFCSSIAYVKNGNDYFVVDRNSGQPLSGVQVKTYQLRYINGESNFKPETAYQTDQHGYFKLISQDSYGSQKLEFYHGNDYLSSKIYNSYYRANEDVQKKTKDEYEKNELRVNFFTDRSIYRPGQTVYFKALLMTKDFRSRKYKIVSNRETIIYLRNANDQIVDSVILHSNDFGSLNGNFKLPQKLLNGEFQLQEAITGIGMGFSVEEYKRPSFFVEYDTLKTAYQIGDSVSVGGAAMAYAGNAIDAAKMSYRVYREARFPYPWLFRSFAGKSTKEIAHGEMRTDNSGKFHIRFMTLPDKAIGRSAKPVYTYRIETTVTDGNGESRSATTTVFASFQSFEIVSPLADQGSIPADSLYQLPVTTNNSSGIFIKENLTVSLYPLLSPGRLIRNRYWQQPDQFVLTEADYIKAFPNDEYRNEADLRSWKLNAKVFEKTDSTRKDGLFAFGKKLSASLVPGWYLIEFRAEDKDGEEIASKKFIQLTGPGGKSGVLSYNLVPEETLVSEPGKDVTIHAGSDAGDIYLVRTKNTITDTADIYSYLNVNSGIKNSVIKVQETDRGGFALNDVFVKNNRWYSSEHIIQVPWTNKELDISYQTWKDKTLPGSKEQWKIKISGSSKDRVAAEVLTSMYDASLDQFKPQFWTIPNIFPIYRKYKTWAAGDIFGDLSATIKQKEYFLKNTMVGVMVDVLISPKRNLYPIRSDFTGASSFAVARPMMEKEKRSSSTEYDSVSFSLTGEMFLPYAVIKPLPKVSAKEEPSQIRKNFNETAFFLPDLKTDSQGNVEINFTMPDALTRWKWMLFASTKDLSFGYSEKTLVTQKELMMQTNIPRFFREGDTMLLPVKISNLSAEMMKGTIELEWLDANTNQPVNEAMGNAKISQPFIVPALQSGVVFFPAILPAHFTQPLLYRIIAKSDSKETDYSDGEENIIPVLSNRMLVTESLPLNMNGKTESHFAFEKLLMSNTSNSLQNQGLTVEYTNNPAWYAVQALPYLMEFPYECAEQTFNRFYANALAGQMVKMTPTLQAVFEKWKNTDTAALLGNLQKNEDLKTVLLNETPWVLQAQSETQQKKNIALLFDLIRLQQAIAASVDKLQQMQSEDGGFAWFQGGRSDRYITQYILSGIGHLKKLNAVTGNLPQLDKMLQSGMVFLDKELMRDYERSDKSAGAENLTSIQIQYLYMRSFFPDISISGSLFPAIHYYRNLSIQKWMGQSVYMQGMIALYLNRSGDIKTSKDILASLKENAVVSDELGMYWKSVRPGYYWHEAPVETQALLIETFQELKAGNKTIDQMKYWLLQQKRTRQWPTTKATAEACYALMLRGTDWLDSKQTATIQLGNYTIRGNEKAEAGTGYFKERIPGDQVKADMGNINITLDQSSSDVQRSTVNGQLPSANHQPPTDIPSWGAVYWQYFEDLDKITGSQTQLSLSKSVFIQKNKDKGPILETLSATTSLKPGDKLIMRIVVRSDRDLEYVHLKDMRAACLEPVNVLSGYQWQDGLGYYQTTKDASTSFFFDRLPKGTFVFEYPVFVTTAGNYSNGISSLECMYAPEFAAHSEGIRIHVESK